MPDRSFWTDALLVIVTLGFYLPYWFYERNKKLVESHPQLDLPDNLWWLVGGLILTVVGMWVGFGDIFWAVAIQVASIIVFSVGVHILVSNGEAAADAEGIEWTVPAPLVSGLFAGAFLAVQAGIVFPSLLARVPALVLVFSLPFVFYRVWEDLDLMIPLYPPPAPPATS